MSTGSIDGQIGFEDVSPEYQAFVDKFKPKKTTDDCYTPKEIYAEVLAWCRERYDIDPEKVVRPFWPGGDYKRFEYPKDCIVLDNPPFSILSQIIKDYNNSGIKYFLFAPYLTNFGTGMACAHIVCKAEITYENGAYVATCFLTNLEPDDVLAISAPDLNARLKRVDAELRKKATKQLPKYSYPVNVVTATMLGYMADHGVDYTLRKDDAVFIRALDSQRAAGKALFGTGFLISEKAAAEKAAAEKAAAEKAAAEKAAAEKAAAEKAAAEKAAAEKAAAGCALQTWELSEREREIIKRLGGNNDD